jgi:DNA-binding transcriptional ArsR family regulator
MTYANALTALADPTRRTVFERLRRGAKSVSDIAEGLPVSRPAVSQHLKVLKDARLVTAYRDGTRQFYAIDTQGLGALRDYLDGFWDDALGAFKAFAEKDVVKRKSRRRRKSR